MKKIKVENKESPEKQKSVIEHYNNYKGKSMVRLKGNFFGGGFNLSKNKMIAIVDNLVALKEFANGKYDEDILKLEEDEVLTP